jgi:hypothetical protein
LDAFKKKEKKRREKEEKKENKKIDCLHTSTQTARACF